MKTAEADADGLFIWIMTRDKKSLKIPSLQQ